MKYLNLYHLWFLFIYCLAGKEIHEKGGRKFAMLTLPPLACMPGNRAGIIYNEELGIISILHNHKLYNKLKEIDTQLEGFMYAIFDIYNTIGDRMTNPSKYGTCDSRYFFTS